MTLVLTRDDAFIGYPKDYLLGIFEGHIQAEAAVGGLIAVGFCESELIILTRPDDAKKVDADGTEHGLAVAAERTVEELGDKDTLDEYSKAAQGGRLCRRRPHRGEGSALARERHHASDGWSLHLLLRHLCRRRF